MDKPTITDIDDVVRKYKYWISLNLNNMDLDIINEYYNNVNTYINLFFKQYEVEDINIFNFENDDYHYFIYIKCKFINFKFLTYMDKEGNIINDKVIGKFLCVDNNLKIRTYNIDKNKNKDKPPIMTLRSRPKE